MGSLHPQAVLSPCCPPATTSDLCLPPTGYLFALGPLLFVSICDVWLELFSRRQAYAINLVAVGVVAFGCTGMWESSWGWDMAGRGGKQPHPQAMVSWDNLLL